MTEEQMDKVRKHFRELFPEAIEVNPGPDGSCPMCINPEGSLRMLRDLRRLKN